MKKVSFEGWKNCIEFSNGKFRIVVTTDVGPRIIGAFVGKSENLMFVDPETAGKAGGTDWKIYGGHRIWHSPEAKPRTYEPDNNKVTVSTGKYGTEFSSGIEPTTGIYKSFAIKALAGGKFQITHKLVNNNLWDVELAAWALTVMDAGGTAVIPVPQGNKKALLPNMYMTVWPYTRLNDPRLVFGEKYILIRQDKTAETPCKIGFNCEDGWMAYVNKGAALVKRFEHMVDAEYPDNGCSIESYTCNSMLEIETLSPLYHLEPKEEILHTEIWECIENVGEIGTEEEAGRIFRKKQII